MRDYDGIARWPLQKKKQLGVRDQLDRLNTWYRTIELKRTKELTRPRSYNGCNKLPILRSLNFIPHSKIFPENEG